MILKYILGLIIGYIMSIVFSIIMTVLRFGIPECNIRLKNETDKLKISALKELRKRYFISLIIWIPISISVSLGCYLWLKNVIWGYLIGLLINIFSIIKNSSKNENNLSDFENSLKSNISFVINKEASK